MKELSLGIAYDYAANIVGAGTYANATALYVIYQATEKLKFNTRFDYASGTEGARGRAVLACGLNQIWVMLVRTVVNGSCNHT